MIPPDCEPRTADETVFEYLSTPDALGRRSFDVYWRTDYNPSTAAPGTRGQAYFADPAPHVSRSGDSGPVRIVDRTEEETP